MGCFGLQPGMCDENEDDYFDGLLDDLDDDPDMAEAKTQENTDKEEN